MCFSTAAQSFFIIHLTTPDYVSTKALFASVPKIIDSGLNAKGGNAKYGCDFNFYFFYSLCIL